MSTISFSLMVDGAGASYGTTEEMRAWGKLRGCDFFQVIRDTATDTLVFVCANAEEIFVVFRGTKDLKNWVTDLSCRLVPFVMQSPRRWSRRAEVHEGFLVALESVWDELRETLKGLARTRKLIYALGHSLGGALAMLGGFWIQDLVAPWPVFVYTFGQPRVGNKSWARMYDRALGTRTFRVVHAQDVVPRVPWFFWFYRHAGMEIFYDANGKRHVNWPWWRKVPSDIRGNWREFLQGDVALLFDHHWTAYQKIFLAERARGLAEGNRQLSLAA